MQKEWVLTGLHLFCSVSAMNNVFCWADFLLWAIAGLHVQAHHPTRSHQAIAAALQRSLPADLDSLLPGRLLHVSSAWVRGCVQVFVWATHLPHQLLGKPGADGSADEADTPAQDGSGAVPSGIQCMVAPFSNSIMSRFASSAAAAGVEDEVDVQINQQVAQR
jgi:hypothetical protein